MFDECFDENLDFLYFTVWELRGIVFNIEDPSKDFLFCVPIDCLLQAFSSQKLGLHHGNLKLKLVEICCG
jgi:hypothetical protein